jgi:hypothetical protein
LRAGEAVPCFDGEFAASRVCADPEALGDYASGPDGVVGWGNY